MLEDLPGLGLLFIRDSLRYGDLREGMSLEQMLEDLPGLGLR
jgi:hypothetical protein